MKTKIQDNNIPKKQKVTLEKWMDLKPSEHKNFELMSWFEEDKYNIKNGNITYNRKEFK